MVNLDKLIDRLDEQVDQLQVVRFQGNGRKKIVGVSVEEWKFVIEALKDKRDGKSTS